VVGLVKRWQAARQSRREILEDVRANGWLSASMWGQRVGGALRDRGRDVREFVSHAPEHAWQAGQKIASRVIGVQRSARLPEHLVERSAWSVLGDRRGPQPSPEWREGYRKVAEAHVPGLAPRVLEPAQPAGPSWPNPPARDDPDREAGG
jgi:hypothetical protein